MHPRCRTVPDETEKEVLSVQSVGQSFRSLQGEPVVPVPVYPLPVLHPHVALHPRLFRHVQPFDEQQPPVPSPVPLVGALPLPSVVPTAVHDMCVAPQLVGQSLMSEQIWSDEA